MLAAVSRICLPTLNSLLYGSTAVSVNDNIVAFSELCRASLLLYSIYIKFAMAFFT